MIPNFHSKENATRKELPTTDQGWNKNSELRVKRSTGVVITRRVMAQKKRLRMFRVLFHRTKSKLSHKKECNQLEHLPTKRQTMNLQDQCEKPTDRERSQKNKSLDQT